MNSNRHIPNRQPSNAPGATSNWQEHIEGKPQYSPPIISLAPAKFTGDCISLPVEILLKNASTLITHYRRLAEIMCRQATKTAGTTSGMLGFMFGQQRNHPPGIYRPRRPMAAKEVLAPERASSAYLYLCLP